MVGAAGIGCQKLRRTLQPVVPEEYRAGFGRVVGGISIPERQGWLLIINFEISMPGQMLCCLNRPEEQWLSELKDQGQCIKKNWL
jgi:hypothetical protein